MDATDNSTPLDKPNTKNKGKSQRETILLAVGLALLVLIALGLPRLTDLPISGRFQTFVTIFLGIFIEAIPFLLFGSIVSGLIEEFVDKDSLARFVPKRAIPALVGALMGFAFPVCECGVVPVTRRLYQKGLLASAPDVQALPPLAAIPSKSSCRSNNSFLGRWKRYTQDGV